MTSKKFYRYLVYEDGRIYSNITNKFLSPDIDNNGYQQVTLFIEKGKSIRIKVHQLVAKLWIGDYPEGKTTIDHIDGNKFNNHYSNLEYVTAYENNKRVRDTGLNNISKSNSDRWNSKEFRERTSKNISIGRKKFGSSKGDKNPRFKYRIFHDEIEISRKELSTLIKKSQSHTDNLIKRAAEGETIELFKSNSIKIVKER